MQPNDLKLLIIDDEPNIRSGLAKGLSKLVSNITEASEGEQGLAEFRRDRHDIVITDLRLPGNINGLEIVKAVRDECPNTQIIVITAYASIETAVEAMRMGASDFITKPLDLDFVRMQLRKAAEHVMLLNENRKLRQELNSIGQIPDIIGNSTATRDLIRQISQVASSDATVLILGESGTGKELTARAIHNLSDRRSNPFVGVNLGALPETLLESELFGHEKGAFTDARRQKAGHFETAREGTLFFDEITETPLKTQVTLLRVIEEREFHRVGGETLIPFNARIISATNQNVDLMISEGKFREDLYYRLNVVPIHLPPLRKRRDDIPLLVEHYLDQFVKRHHRETKRLSAQAMRHIVDRPWPGNIIQLKNFI